MKSTFSPNDYKHLESDSAMIQAAVDEAAKYGAKVEIPRYNERTGEFIWNLDKTIFLHTGSYVVLDNCHLRLCDGEFIHFFQNTAAGEGRRGETYYKKDRQYDITIEGHGNATLDGGKPLDVCEGDFNVYNSEGQFVEHREIKGYNSMVVNIGILFINVERVSVSGLRFINDRYWGMAFYYCSFGTVRDIYFEAWGDIPNQDGIDIRTGCNNFLVENITGFTGDDTVALTGLDINSRPSPDLCPDIHHIIIRDIRSKLTTRCDTIRLLNQGGVKLYNILIDGVMDLSEEGDPLRALAAIRIGDLSDYRQRLNTLGETRDIVIRNVSTRAKFGAYIANTLCDATFENFKLYGDGGIGMYFNGCELKNITVRDFGYNSTSCAPDSDKGYIAKFHKVEVNELSAVDFNNCKSAENILFENVVSGKNLSYVFGGNSAVKIMAKNVSTNDENTILTKCATVIEG